MTPTFTTLFRSADRGESWKRSTLRASKLGDSLHAAWAVHIAIRYRAGHPATILVYANFAAYLSRDGGQHWTGPLVQPGSAAHPVDIAGAEFGPGPPGFYASIGTPYGEPDGLHTEAGPCKTSHTGYQAVRYDASRRSWRNLAPAPALVSTATKARMTQISSGDPGMPGIYWLQTQALPTAPASLCSFMTRILRYTP